MWSRAKKRAVSMRCVFCRMEIRDVINAVFGLPFKKSWFEISWESFLYMRQCRYFRWWNYCWQSSAAKLYILIFWKRDVTSFYLLSSFCCTWLSAPTNAIHFLIAHLSEERRASWFLCDGYLPAISILLNIYIIYGIAMHISNQNPTKGSKR